VSDSERHYDMHLDDKFGHLARFDLGAEAAANEPWFNPTLLIDLEGRDTVVLERHQGITVPRGVEHRTRAPRRTAILMVEAAGVRPTGS
jgi:hypothetical protein